MRLLLVARIAAAIAAVLALVALASSIPAVMDAAPSATVVELWRLVGLATWAALFALLAARPSLVPVWAIAVVSKASLVVGGLVLGDAVPGAADLVLWDGVLTVVLAVGLVAAVAARLSHAPASQTDAPAPRRG